MPTTSRPSCKTTTNHYKLYVDRTCMHEFVLDGRSLRQHGARTLDLAKRLIGAAESTT